MLPDCAAASRGATSTPKRSLWRNEVSPVNQRSLHVATFASELHDLDSAAVPSSADRGLRGNT